MNNDINNPNIEPTTNISPFKFFTLTNFPYIEQTFDTLTNYELLCKIVEELNKLIKNNNITNQNVINLYNNFVNLKNYVDQYFDDLNIQNEVNNKLDVMANDGTLATIINENIFNELNSNLENLSNKVGNETLPNPDLSISQNINILNNKIGSESLPNPDESIISNINTLNDEIESNELTELIIFGDSWSDPAVDGVVYPNIIASILKLNLHNYAKSGANMIGNSTIDFDAQINNFIVSSVNKTKVKYIILLGGINDYRDSVNRANLRTKINELENQLKTLCPNAYILYISNCQFPMSSTQSEYWKHLHANLSAGGAFGSLNLDGLFSASLMNNTLFHLNVPGQQLLAKIITTCLTGVGEITRYPDYRKFENDDAKVEITTDLLDSIAIVNVKLTTKTSKTQYNVYVNDNLGDINFGGESPFTVIYDYSSSKPIACDLLTNRIGVACSSALPIKKVYIFNFVINIR